MDDVDGRVRHLGQSDGAAYRLRFRVFNLEMGKGLNSSFRTGLDTDHFDLFCDHLLVEDHARPGSPVRMWARSTLALRRFFECPLMSSLSGLNVLLGWKYTCDL